VATGFPQLSPIFASRGTDESSSSVYPNALATFSASVFKFISMQFASDSDQALSSYLQVGSAPAFALALYASLTASVMTAASDRGERS